MRITRTLLSLTILVSVLSAASAPASAAECWYFHDYETDLARLTNKARANKGLRKLTLDPEMSMAARVHSREMARSGRPFHSTTDSLSALLKGTWVRMSENVGAGGSVKSMHREFLESRTHRANIFGRGWDRIGIGTVTVDGRTWTTVLFEEGRDLGTKLNKRYCG